MVLTKITPLTIWSLSTSLEHFLPRPPPLITAPLQLGKAATENVDFLNHIIGSYYMIDSTLAQCL